jgi:hypothetical protein
VEQENIYVRRNNPDDHCDAADAPEETRDIVGKIVKSENIRQWFCDHNREHGSENY